MRPWLLLFTIALGLTACGARGDSQGAASCVGPSLSVTPTTVQRGGTVHLFGQWLTLNCADTVVNGQAEPWVAVTGADVVVSQDHHSWTVASGVDALGQNFVINMDVAMPTVLHPGAATIGVVEQGRLVVNDEITVPE